MSFNPNIVVFGVGGAGCNAVNNMVEKKLQGVQFVAANTDMQSLIHSNADIKIQLGTTLTQGLGAGGNPETGREAARENIVEIKETLKNCNMLFITAGMGGGTGTGAAPLVAKIAKEMGVLTIGVITKPFAFEGRKKMDVALDGIRAMKDQVGTLITVPNQNLMSLANEKTTNREAFLLADQVLYNGVAGISDIIVRPGHINLDLADLRGVMSEMGRAVLGTGEASGKDRATIAAQRAIQNPLLENTDIGGARQLLINISGGDDLTLFETEKAIAVIASAAGSHCNIHIGSSTDSSLTGKIRVSLVATGIKGEGASVASQLLKPFQGGAMDDSNSEQHLAAIKNTALNPLRPQQEDGQGEVLREESFDKSRDESFGDERPYGQTGAMGDAAPSTTRFGANIHAMARSNNIGNIGRPAFDNPFDTISPNVGEDNDGAHDKMTSEATGGVAREMADFDNFSQTINADGDNAKEENFDLGNEFGNDGDSSMYQREGGDGSMVGGRATKEAKELGGKKPGLFKKVFSAFFGAQEEEDDIYRLPNDGDDGLHNMVDGVEGDGSYPAVVDLRGAQDKAEEHESPSGKLTFKRRSATRKKQAVEEEITSDLFSMPGIE